MGDASTAKAAAPSPELADLLDDGFTEGEALSLLEQRKKIGCRVLYDERPGVIVGVEPHLEYGYLFNVEYKDKGYGDIEVSEIKAALAAAGSVPSASAMPAPLAAVAAARRGAAAPAAARQQTLLSWRPGPPPT
jgi:hypothetical protein